MKRSASNLALLRWVGTAAWRHRRGVAALAGLMLLQALVQAATPWPMKVLVDQGLSQLPAPSWLASLLSVLPAAESSLGLVAWTVAATILLFAAAAGLGIGQALLTVTVGQRMVYSTAADLFAKLQRLSLAFHARRGIGDSMRRLTTDCGAIAIIIRDALLPSLAALFTVLVMFWIMVKLNPTMALVALIAVPLLILVIRKLTPPVLEQGYRYAEAEARVWDVAERTLTVIPVIQAFSAESRAEDQVRSAYRAVYSAALDLTRAQFRLKIISGIITAGGAAVILLFGAREVLAERLTVGGLLVFLSYLAALYAPLDAMVFAAGSASEAAGGARRVLELLAEEEGVADSTDAVALTLTAPPRITFDAIDFTYPQGSAALRGLSLDIAPGQTVALVGASGAGKTTLAGLVPRLFDPQHGRVMIDGRDLRTLTLRSLREHVAILLQDTYLFPVTIAENIAYARPEASREQVEAAAAAAGAHEFIQRLPDGYDTVVGQRGATLSGGERQRIAIARALLKDAPILILDEPTSALDAHTEARLLQALDRLRRGRTTLIIAHRLSTIRSADLIVVLDHGRIVESGSHEQLITHGGHYAHLQRLQCGLSENHP